MRTLDDIQGYSNIHCTANNADEHAKVSWPAGRQRATEVLHADHLRNHDPECRSGPAPSGAPYGPGSMSAKTGRSKLRTRRRHCSATGPAIVRLSTCAPVDLCRPRRDSSIFPSILRNERGLTPSCGRATPPSFSALSSPTRGHGSTSCPPLGAAQRQCPGHHPLEPASSLDSRTCTVQLS